MLIIIFGLIAWMVVIAAATRSPSAVAWSCRGGGSDPIPSQVIPAPPPPNVGQNAAELAQAQLEFNPQLTQQSLDIQRQFGIPFAQQQFDVAQFQAPLFRSLLESQFPQVGLFGGQVEGRLRTGEDLTPDQLARRDESRELARGQTRENVRQSANLGGTLFSGNRQLNEERALGELEQGFVESDINRQLALRQQTANELVTLLQLAGLPVQQPAVPTFTQGVTPSGDALLAALVQNAGNFGVTQGVQGGPGFGSAFAPSFSLA